MCTDSSLSNSPRTVVPGTSTLCVVHLRGVGGGGVEAEDDACAQTKDDVCVHPKHDACLHPKDDACGFARGGSARYLHSVCPYSTALEGAIATGKAYSPQSSILNPQPSTLNPQPSTIYPQPSS